MSLTHFDTTFSHALVLFSKRPSKGSWRQATSLQNCKKCSDNLVPEHRQPTEPDGKKATIWDSDNLFLTSTKRHLFTLFRQRHNRPGQHDSKSSLLLVLLHLYCLCKLRYIKQTIIQHLTHLLCSDYRVCAAFLPGGGGGGGNSKYRWVGRCGAAPHTLNLFKTNIADIPTLFKTEFRFLIPCLRHLMCLVSMPKSREVNIN